MVPRTIQVLLVEDDPADVDLTRKALSKCEVAVDLHCAEDGVEAMEFLHRKGAHSEAPRPQLILLDLNLPRRDGRSVLQGIREDDTLGTIPVIVLSSSTADSDVAACYELGANCYMVKALDFHEFRRQVVSLSEFWFTVVRFPAP